MGVLKVINFYCTQATRPIRYSLRLLLRPEIIHIHGVCFPIPDNASEEYRRRLYLGRHEWKLALMIMAKLKRYDKVLEMGAGRGVLSTLCAKTVGSEKVFTYEANPALIPFIESVYSLNGVKPRLVNAAVGTMEAKSPFNVCDGDRTASSSLLSTSAPSETIHISQVDVNQLISDIRPTFLIVDIEGSEKEVLKVANLDGVRIIALEVHKKKLGPDGCAELDAAIVSKGFRLNRRFSSSGRKLYERP